MTQFTNPQRSLAIAIAMTAFSLIMLYVLGIYYVLHIELLADSFGIATFALLFVVLAGSVLVAADGMQYLIAEIHNPGAGWRWARADCGPEWGH